VSQLLLFKVLGSRLIIERGYERRLIGYTYVYKMLEKCKFFNDGGN
jgi:hypothetical protein